MRPAALKYVRTKRKKFRGVQFTLQVTISHSGAKIGTVWFGLCRVKAHVVVGCWAKSAAQELNATPAHVREQLLSSLQVSEAEVCKLLSLGRACGSPCAVMMWSFLRVVQADQPASGTYL